MEHILTFVLGVSVGSLIIILISLHRNLLKIKKEVAQSSADIQESYKRFDEFDRNINTRISKFYDDLYSDILQIKKDFKQNDKDLNELISNRSEDLTRYVDKRCDQTTSHLREFTEKQIEKTVEALCIRMDSQELLKK
jgi:predicted Holliday junction resolvase-like endonuclease